MLGAELYFLQSYIISHNLASAAGMVPGAKLRRIEMSFSYTSTQAEKLASRWNELANDRNQISAADVHHIFGDNADYDIAKDGATLIELSDMHSATGAPETFYVTRADVDAPKYLATISHHSISFARSVPVGDTLHAAKINATREFGDGYLDNVIQIIDVTDGDGAVVASRFVGEDRWT